MRPKRLLILVAIIALVYSIYNGSLSAFVSQAVAGLTDWLNRSEGSVNKHGHFNPDRPAGSD